MFYISYRYSVYDIYTFRKSNKNLFNQWIFGRNSCTVCFSLSNIYSSDSQKYHHHHLKLAGCSLAANARLKFIQWSRLHSSPHFAQCRKKMKTISVNTTAFGCFLTPLIPDCSAWATQHTQFICKSSSSLKNTLTRFDGSFACLYTHTHTLMKAKYLSKQLANMLSHTFYTSVWHTNSFVFLLVRWGTSETLVRFNRTVCVFVIHTL